MIKHGNIHPSNLELRSLRTNKILLTLIGAALLLISMSYWAINRVLTEESDKLSFHFSRTIESINEHENFLYSISESYGKANEKNSADDKPGSTIKLTHQGDEILFQNRNTPRSLPFTISQRDRFTSDQTKGVFSLGVQLTDSFTAYWSESIYSAPQAFIFSPSNKFTIALPGIDGTRNHPILLKDNFFNISKRIYDQLLTHKKSLQKDKALWMRAPKELMKNRSYMIGAVSISLPHIYIPGANKDEAAILTTLLDISDLERLLLFHKNTRFSLISPMGETLIGDAKNITNIPMGLSFGQHGLRIKLRSSTAKYWTGLYEITYRNFFGYAKWSLLTITSLLLLLLLISWRISHWYRVKIVEPAYQASVSLAESEEFNRTILDNAPIGLCVVQRGTGTILLENQRAQKWQGTLELIKVLKRDYVERSSGQIQIHIAGRYLQACYALTRYKGKDVVLCGFNDITSHIDDSQLLDQARRDADDANKAKTIFLATMSHEIRTPLYGLLGNLELLTLTHLTEKQQNYLLTIQRSSTTLLQLISDILDMSKIESGLMQLENTEFFPLDILEDTAQSYSATADKKGLTIFYCADANIPTSVLGDKSKIHQIINNLVSNAIKFTDSGRIFLRLKVIKSEQDHIYLQWQVTDTGTGISKQKIAQLFKPFSQVCETNQTEGSGLGLSICSKLSQAMGAELTIVSELGLGSSFSLNIRLPIANNSIPRASDIDLSGINIYVRAPFKEIEQSTLDWLNRWGARALGMPTSDTNTLSGILLNLYPETLQPLTQQWQGKQIFATAQGGYSPKITHQGLEIGAFDIRTIAIAAMQLAHNTISHETWPSPKPASTLNIKVLVAEDNPVNRVILEEQLLTLGAQVTSTGDGNEAFAKWNEEIFDFVITDVNMPHLNGYQLTRKIRELDSNIPIIGVTANAIREEGERCIQAGMDAWLVKPLRIETLRKALIANISSSRIPTPKIATTNTSTFKKHDPNE